MAILATSKATNRHYRSLRKKRKMKKKNQPPAIRDTQKTGTRSVLLTLLCLMGIFAILAYLRPD